MSSSPYVTFDYLNRYHGHIVRLVGEAIEPNGNPVQIKGTDGHIVNIIPAQQLPQDRFTSSKWVEVMGIVQSDNSINEMQTTPYNSSVELDVDAWNQMVQLTQQYNEIF